MAIQIQIFEREITRDGKEIREETDRFTIYPPQVVLMPKQKRTIRVNWKGTENPDKELSFRLIAEELPVDLESKKADSRTQLNFLLKYVASIYVRPKNVNPKVSVKSTRLLPAEKGKQEWELILENTGTAHQVLSTMNIQLEMNKKTVYLDSKTKKIFAAENILAKSERRFILPWPPELKAGDFKVNIKFDSVPSTQ